MGLKKCSRCKKVFAPIANQKVCPKCLEKEENQYKVVKDYLWENPGATISQIHEDTQVEERLIQKFVKEGRFLQIKGVKLSVECEKCGKSIQSGRFCSECSQKLQDGINTVKKSIKTHKKVDSKTKMFLRDRIKRR